MKRVISLLLVAIMSLSLLVGCGGSGNKKGDNTLTIGIPLYGSVSNFDDNPLTKYVEEQLGCELSRNCNLRKLCGFNDVYIICLDMLTMNYL